MCGLNGAFAFSAAATAPTEAEMVATRDHMRARGPDGSGLWWSEGRRCALAHRRLSIIDLSPAGAQPMHSADGGLVVVFNGEIYNYPELKTSLEAKGCRFSTHSDTEVLLHLYTLYGEEMAVHLRGMFTFAIWDSRRRGLLLGRDPYGIKPLYTAQSGGVLRFASQVKALLAGGQVSREPEPAGVVGFHLFGSVIEPFTLYRDVRALPAGTTQWVDENGPREPRPFVNIAAILAQGALQPAEAGGVATRVRNASLASVRAHLLADVEVGAFLSAGIDSGALLGLMRDAGQSRIRAITLSFEEFRGTAEDEAPLAALVAQRYEAEHHVRHVGEDEFHRDLPAILEAMDQPSVDGVNTWFVSKAAREAGLKVAISGLGGDELLAGYPSFTDIPRWTRMLRVPGAVPGLGLAARKLAQALPGFAARWPKAPGMLEYGASYTGAYLLRRAVLLPFELKTVMDPEMARRGLRDLALTHRLGCAMTPDPGSDVGRVGALEAQIYMRNQILRDADWAGMAHSLEIRTPLVDIDLLRDLATITPHFVEGVGKRALAMAPLTPLPAEVINRAKTGFSVPTARWTNAAGAQHMRKGATSRSWGRYVLSRHEQDLHAA